MATDSAGHVWVGDYANNRAIEYNNGSAGIPPAQIGSVADTTGRVCHLGLDSANNLFLNQWNGPVDRYVGGTFASTVDPDASYAVSVDPADDHLFVVHSSSINEYDAASAPVEQFGSDVLSSAIGVAVNRSTGSVYVSQSSGVVDIFGPRVVVPDVTTGAATDIQRTSATLTGTVNPEGLATSYYFQYGTTTGYGQKAPPSPARVGPGTKNVNVAAAIVSLAPDTTYHYRLVASNASGMNVGDDHSFKTKPAPPGAPAVVTGGATSVSVTSAKLTGTVSPEGQGTSYYFEYGTTTGYGQKKPSAAAGAGSGTNAVNVAAAIVSLAPNTTYHYRLVATNASGTSYGKDRTFTTRAVPPANNSPPVISGLTAVGRKLSASTGRWSGTPPLTFSYRWQRCKPLCATIGGATKQTYTPVKADIDARLRVIVRATNSAATSHASSKQVGPVAPAANQIEALLGKLLTPKGKAAKIAALLTNGGYTLSFKTLSGGRITIQWYYLPKGASLTKPTRKPKPVLLATGTVTFAQPRTVKLTIKLTPTGKRKLNTANRMKLTAKGTYTPTSGHGVTATTTFTLKR